MMDRKKELNQLLQKVGKIVPTMIFAGVTEDQHGAFLMGSPEDTDEKRMLDVTASVAMMMDEQKAFCDVIFAAVAWFMQDNPKYRDGMQKALDRMKEIDGHKRTAEPE